MSDTITIICSNCKASLKVAEIDKSITVISCTPDPSVKPTKKTKVKGPDNESILKDSDNRESAFQRMISGSDEDDD